MSELDDREPVGYRGNRRRAGPPGYRWAVAAALGLAVLAAALALRVGFAAAPLASPAFVPVPPSVPGSQPVSPTPVPEPSASSPSTPTATSRPRTPSRPPSASPPSAPPGTPGAYEAEAAQRGGAAEVRTLPRASGGRFVGNIGDRSANFLRFIVTAPLAGRYTVSIEYICGESRRYAYLKVNGEADWVRFGSTGGWDKVGSMSVQVRLRAGSNTIEFGNPYAWAPDFDRIVLR